MQLFIFSFTVKYNRLQLFDSFIIVYERSTGSLIIHFQMYKVMYQPSFEQEGFFMLF